MSQFGWVCQNTYFDLSENEDFTFNFQFAKIDAKKAEEARRREKPVEINEWDDEENEDSINDQSTHNINEVST